MDKIDHNPVTFGPGSETETSLPYLENKPRRETKVDKLNEMMAAKAYDDPKATHIKTLHPTKGWRWVSIKRMINAGDIHHRMNIFWTTIALAAKAKAEREEAENGKNETAAT